MNHMQIRDTLADGGYQVVRIIEGRLEYDDEVMRVVVVDRVACSRVTLFNLLLPPALCVGIFTIVGFAYSFFGV
jgi:hypothetical protein